MKILEVTSREFRDKQRFYFDKAEKGIKIIIKRGRNKSFILTPITADDLQLSPEMEKKIELAIKEAQEGKTIKVNNKEELESFLESL